MNELRAFVLAAGLGTRLRPFTDDIPKPLLPVFHKPLITFAFDNLIAAGIKEIAFNTRHLPESFYREFSVEKKTSLEGIGNYNGHSLKVFYEPEQLDTGGGLRNARSFLERGTFLIHNGDILSDIPLQELVTSHRASGAMATLLLREDGGAKNVLFDEKNNRILDIRSHFKTSHDAQPCVYTGIAIAEPELISWITAKDPTSTIDALLDAIKAGRHVAGLVSRSGFWSDLGTPETYLNAHLTIARDGWKSSFLIKNPAFSWPMAIHPSSSIDPSAKLKGMVVVGEKAAIAHDAELENCVLLPGAKVAAGTQLSNMIVAGFTKF